MWRSCCGTRLKRHCSRDLTAGACCEAIKARTDLFLSINHEIKLLTVRDLCASLGMTSTIRSPYWMRRGYVEEIFPTEPLVTWCPTTEKRESHRDHDSPRKSDVSGI
jgi:hypothetical protein